MKCQTCSHYNSRVPLPNLFLTSKVSYLYCFSLAGSHTHTVSHSQGLIPILFLTSKVPYPYCFSLAGPLLARPQSKKKLKFPVSVLQGEPRDEASHSPPQVTFSGMIFSFSLIFPFISMESLSWCVLVYVCVCVCMCVCVCVCVC